MADQRDQTRSSGCHLPGRGLYAAEGHAPCGEARVLPVVYVFYVPQYQAGADRLLHGTESRSRAAILPAQRLAKYARYPSRDPPVGPATHLCGKTDSCRDALLALRHIWADVRADGKRAARTGERGISRLGKISAAALDLAAARQPLVADCPYEPHSTRKYRAAIRYRTAFLQNRERSVDRLFEGGCRELERDSYGRQPRSAPSPVGLGRSRYGRLEVRSRSALPGA